MIKLRYNGVIKEFDCTLKISQFEDKYEYKDVNSGEFDTYIRGTWLEFTLDGFSKFMSITDIKWLNDLNKNGGEIQYEVEESAEIVPRWILVKGKDNNLQKSINLNTKLETDLFQFKEISTITFRTIRYVEKGIIADIIPVEESES